MERVLGHLDVGNRGTLRKASACYSYAAGVPTPDRPRAEATAARGPAVLGTALGGFACVVVRGFRTAARQGKHGTGVRVKTHIRGILRRGRLDLPTGTVVIGGRPPPVNCLSDMLLMCTCC